jgi:hypothetical protein
LLGIAPKTLRLAAEGGEIEGTQANERILTMRPTGHIRQRSPKSFEIRYSLGTDKATGKDRYATATVVGTRKDAERELRRRLLTLDTGEHVDSDRITVGKWLADWLATVRGELAPKSYERYAEMVGVFGASRKESIGDAGSWCGNDRSDFKRADAPAV